MILNILFLPVAICIGLLSVWQDIKFRKIKNKLMIGGFLWGILVYFGLFLWRFFGQQITYFVYDNILGYQQQMAHPVFSILDGFFAKSLINTLIALFIAFFLWKIKTWGAGDAKLFTLLVFLTPVQYYASSYLKVFPAFAFLLNIFILVLVWFLIQALLIFLREIRRGELVFFKKLKNVFDPSLLINFSLLFLFFINLKFFLDLVNWQSEKTIFYAALIIFLFFSRYLSLNKTVRNVSILSLITLTLILIMFNFSQLSFYWIGEFSLQLVIFFIIFLLINNLFNLYLREAQKFSRYLRFSLWIYLAFLVTLAIRGWVFFWLTP